MTDVITISKKAKGFMRPIAFCVFGLSIFLLAYSPCFADDMDFSVCEQVSVEQLRSISQVKLFPMEQERGCQWSNKPSGLPHFQIGIIESHKDLREFFHKELPDNYSMMKVNDIGDRGLMTVSGEYLSVIVIRGGDWVLISTLNNLQIKMNSMKHDALWDIYRGMLQRLR